MSDAGINNCDHLAGKGVLLLPGAAQVVDRALRSGTGAARLAACVILQDHVFNSLQQELIRLSGAGICSAPCSC